MKNPERVSLITLNAFLGSLTSLRSHHGVPISIVFLSTSTHWARNQLSSLDSSSLLGESGIHLREFHAPPNVHLLHDLIEYLYFEERGGGNKKKGQVLPILLPGTVLRKLRELFLDQHGSVVTTVIQMKMALAYHFTQKGTCTSHSFQRSKMGRYSIYICILL